ncbi:hypothetical protein GQ55_3G051900 [Panicum hallii var. hallii]|uniref:Secreted protein n=1 Tax=Panicum hallii var. hallii TaxID=1504633 RepID=A0A2T7E5X2_9POAL|nr:hypothetical protein GQ55_3G051900 [Panicum hallii var. hallii]
MAATSILLLVLVCFVVQLSCADAALFLAARLFGNGGGFDLHFPGAASSKRAVNAGRKATLPGTNN